MKHDPGLLHTLNPHVLVSLGTALERRAGRLRALQLRQGVPERRERGAGAALLPVEKNAAVCPFHPVPPIAAAPIATEAGLEDPLADWCAPGFEPIHGDACLASVSGKPSASLVVYLHGRYARDAASEEVDRQRRLAARATALGFAVIALRGRLGTCTAPELAEWYCWPSNETNADAGPELV